MRTLSIDPEQTWEDMTVQIAADRGVFINYEEADYALWEYTAFPCDKPQRVAEQLDRLFAGIAGVS